MVFSISASTTRRASLRQRATTNPSGLRRASFGASSERMLSRTGYNSQNFVGPSDTLSNDKKAAMSALSRACPSSMRNSGCAPRSFTYHAPRCTYARRSTSAFKPRRVSVICPQIVAGLPAEDMEEKCIRTPPFPQHNPILKSRIVSRTAGRSSNDTHTPTIVHVVRASTNSASTSPSDVAHSVLATPARIPKKEDVVPSWKTESLLDRHTLQVPLPGYTQEMIMIYARHGHALSVVADMWYKEQNCHHEWKINFRPGDVDISSIRADLAANGMLSIFVNRYIRH